jgi:hypothetical protein
MSPSFQLLTLKPKRPLCPGLQAVRQPLLERVLSRVHVRLSEETRLERLADPSAWSGVDENDPKSVAKVLKKMGQEMGEDFPGEVDEMVEEAMDSQGGDAPGETDL